MNERILLLTKDAMCKAYLPVYGNQYWKGNTPNIDELAAKGTVLNHYFTAAPSTVMAFRAMMMGKFAHEQPFDRYIPQEVAESETDFFVEASRLGYSCHIIWDEKWEKMVLKYGNCYGSKTMIHNLSGLRQSVGCHYGGDRPIIFDSQKSAEAIERLIQKVDSICKEHEKILLWIHLPHVINGRTGYGSDIDLFDEIVGRLRQYFSDDSIFISADHGNMNGVRGKYGYGFDVHTSSIEIPFIGPHLNNAESICNTYISNVDIKGLILYKTVAKRDFIFADSTYYAQPKRKTAIIHNGMLYIYSKSSKTEELYDMEYDPGLTTNLINDVVKDVDRMLKTPINEVYFNPSWERIHSERELLRKKREEIWKKGPLYRELSERALSKMKRIYVGIKHHTIGK